MLCKKPSGRGGYACPLKKEPAGSPLVASTKSERAEADCAAPTGRGASPTVERRAASLGELDEAAPRFEPALDVSNGGVLLALPALLACGLLRHAGKYFRLPAGFYGLKTIFLLLAFMALARLKSIEALRYCAPGEWGKLLGLDRAPEVRTLRVKVKTLADQEQALPWSSELCKEWMAQAPEEAAVLYVDGHVRVYYGNTKQLPKHYIARERLCLSATADYWVNAMDGKPFFVVSQAVDPGLLQVLECDIVPRLENDVPNQPGSDQLEADPLLHRFTVVFDREGYSPNFFVKMKDRRIACLTYRKYPGEDWPQQEFFPTGVRLSSGQLTAIRLAERGTWLGDQLWVHEVRKLTESGHQTAVLATDYKSSAARLGPAMFARWSQENFFRYMRQSYNLDGLVDYGTDIVPDATMVVNPAYRTLDGQARKKIGVLNRKIAEFGAVNLEGEIDPSASCPAAIVPSRSSRSTWAASRVPATIASIGVSPPLVTSISSSICVPNPKYCPPFTPPASVPTTNRAPAAFSLPMLRTSASPCACASGFPRCEKSSPSSRISSGESVSRRIGSSIQTGFEL